MKNLILGIFTFVCVGCSPKLKDIRINQDINSYEELSAKYISCTGRGIISSIGDYKGKLSFSFLSQNDSSFFQFQDFLGRKVLLMWLTPNSAEAWNILENKRYNYDYIKGYFPLLSVVNPINLTKFLWGNESIYDADDFTVKGEKVNELSITFEKSNENEDLIDKAIFKDITNRKEISIILKSRVHSNEYINLEKIWKMVLI
tara:strand:- start:1875 stop:2480 length:606 start_codon:yes stop_codon:yes gene_type:complete